MKKLYSEKAAVSLLFLFSFLLTVSNGAKILFLLPIASRSHVHVFEPYISGLASRGHDIVSISPMILPNMPSNVEQIMVIDVDQVLKTSVHPFEMRKAGKLATLFNSTSTGAALGASCNKVFDHPRVQRMLKEESFDLVVIDILANFCVAGIVHHFKAPSIQLTTMAAPNYIANRIGNRPITSFVPSNFFEFTDRMSFLERVSNTVLDLFVLFMSDNFFIQVMDKVYQDRLGKNYPSSAEIGANMSMLFMNSHPVMTFPRPLLPDVIEVGGMHCKDGKKLPKVQTPHSCVTFLPEILYDFFWFSISYRILNNFCPDLEMKDSFCLVWGPL